MNFYQKCHRIVAGLVRHIFRLRVIGIENLPESGSQLFCSNHTGELDVLVISSAFKRQVRYMAKKELFSVPLIGSLVKALGAYPVDRGGTDVASIKKTVEILKDGGLVGMFPQGTRYRYVDPRTTKVKSGVGLIAYRSGADVIPAYIKTKNNRTLMFRRATLIIGKPIKNSELGFENGGRAEYESAANLIFDRICTLGESGDTAAL